MAKLHRIWNYDTILWRVFLGGNILIILWGQLVYGEYPQAPMEGVEIDNFPRFKGDPSAWMIFCMFLCPPFSRIFRCSQSNCAPASAMAVRSSFLFFSGGATLDISFVTYTKTSTTIHPASSNPTCTPPPPAAAGAKPGNFSAILLLGHVTF